MKVSSLIKENQLIDSKAFNELSPLMKEAVKDVYKIINEETDSIIDRFENAVAKVAKFHNINKEKFDEYFDKEILEQLGEK
jgi:vacuolar-type H+-ATPase subunit H